MCPEPGGPFEPLPLGWFLEIFTARGDVVRSDSDDFLVFLPPWDPGSQVSDVGSAGATQRLADAAPAAKPRKEAAKPGKEEINDATETAAEELRQ